MDPHKCMVEVEVTVNPSGEHSFDEVETSIIEHLKASTAVLTLGGTVPIPRELQPSVLGSKVVSIEAPDYGKPLKVPCFQAAVRVFPYCQSAEPPSLEEAGGEDGDGSEAVTAAHHWEIPHVAFDPLWDSLVFDDSEVKGRLLRYAETALLFADMGVDSSLVTTNRMLLFHGPPGTGKTTICKALAHKLAIRLNSTYHTASLLEINSHSLFSRWFSESGKLVARLFESIHSLAEADEGNSLVCVLIDEVESLTAARQSSMSGNEPSDAVRVVNALLTEIDRLRARPNVLVLATSNLTEAIDPAFLDRADLKQYVGPPVHMARYRILLSSISELVKRGIVDKSDGMPAVPPPDATAPVSMPEGATGTLSASASASPRATGDPSTSIAQQTMRPAWMIAGGPATSALMQVAAEAEMMSGRSLRKLPFQAHAFHLPPKAARAVSMATHSAGSLKADAAGGGGVRDARGMEDMGSAMGSHSREDAHIRMPAVAVSMEDFLRALLAATRHEQKSRDVLSSS